MICSSPLRHARLQRGAADPLLDDGAVKIDAVIDKAGETRPGYQK
jgi:hypothetical protein